MTPAQQARLEGFLASLGERGVLLTLERTEDTFLGLVQEATVDTQEFPVGDAESVGDWIHVLRSDCPEDIRVGDSLLSLDEGFSHRVVRVKDRPISITIQFQVETARLPS